MATALLVIDAQNIYTQPDYELCCKDTERTIGHINELVARFEKMKQPIIFVRHIHKKDGSDLGRMFDFAGEPEEGFNFKEGSQEVEYDIRLQRPKDSVEIVKNRYSAFVGTTLDSLLQKNKVKRVVICGFMTNFCCDSTARDAHDRDYYVDFVVDATGTPGTDNLSQSEIRKTVAELLGAGYANIQTTSQCLKTKYT